MSKTKKVLVWMTGVLITVVLLLFGYFFYWDKVEDYLQRRAFVSSEWKDEKVARKPPYPRLRMVDDLLRKEKLIGKTRAEVISLLGEPPNTEYFSEYDLVYWLGPERSFMSIDSEWLVMKLDSSGRVIECTLTKD